MQYAKGVMQYAKVVMQYAKGVLQNAKLNNQLSEQRAWTAAALLRPGRPSPRSLMIGR